MWSPVTWLIVAGILFLDLLGFFVHFLWRTHQGQGIHSANPMAGKIGVVTRDIGAPGTKGKVKIDGVLWDAVSGASVEKGEQVQVLDGKGITLNVKKLG